MVSFLILTEECNQEVTILKKIKEEINWLLVILVYTNIIPGQYISL